MALELEKHPCFSAEAKGKFGRVHLPVAPACNMQCNFCHRKFDCANESRPGVTSVVLTPEQAIAYLRKVVGNDSRISVVGIAGPGDPFANADKTMQTLRLVREHYPDMLLCVATNGLAVGPHVPELAELKVSHVTITVNAVEPEISAKVYSWIRDGYRPYRGIEAGQLLWERQREAIANLSAHGVVVKVNTILMPGVNDHHIGTIAKTVKELGADVLNIIPLYPVAETPFETIPAPSSEMIHARRAEAGEVLPLMKHCARCRADAAGLLSEGTSQVVLGWLKETADGPKNPLTAPAPTTPRPYVAVTSQEGVLVNQHLGEAGEVWIYGEDGKGGYALVEKRSTPAMGTGSHRWMELARRLSDCRAVLTAGCGASPQMVLDHAGLKVIMTECLIDEAVEAVYQGQELRIPVRAFKCGSDSGSCAGTGTGCG